MQSKSSWLDESSKKLIEQPGMACAVIALAASMPFLSTIAAILLAFISLRKGAREGANALVAASISHAVVLYLLSNFGLNTAIVLSLTVFTPVYLSALVLRKFASWSVVGGVIFAQAALGSIVVNLWMPEILTNLYQAMGSQLEELLQLSAMFSKKSSFSPSELSHILLSGQLFFAAFGTGLSLLIARYLQARCYNPGGLKSELRYFRSGRLSLFIMAALLLAYHYQQLAAMDLLPMMLLYFVLAGLNFIVVVPQKFRRHAIMLLVMMLLFSPYYIVFNILIVFAGLDSLFNFRSYLPKKAVS